MIEMAIVIAIIGVITAIAMVSLSRSRPRATLAGAAADLQALLHGARQQALASGQDVGVLVFPNQATPGGAKGRIAVVLDGDHFLLDPAETTYNLDSVKSAQIGVGPNSELLTTLDLPAGVEVGPVQGLGAAFKLVAPYATIPVNADCTFCDGDADKRRGAILFDSRGRARFYPKVGPPLAVDGGSLSLTAPALQNTAGAGATRTLAVGASTGTIKAINGGG
jgi:type II secretory pathway pseudopilin PulG